MNSLAYFRGAAVTSFAFILCILFGIRLASVFACTGDECRMILFEEPIPNKAISGHVIRILEVPNEGSCRTMCYMEPDCVSINVRPSEGGKYKCELNNATVDEDQLTFLDDRDTTYYLAIENPCRSSPCYNGSTCQVGFTSKGFRCICPTGFPGISCLKAKSCSDLKKLDPTAKNGSYVIDPDGEGGLLPYNVTCDMSDKGGIGVTVISHDSENRTQVDSCQKPGCYSRDIHYTGSCFRQLASLTNVSLHCEQFIKYECQGSLMFSKKRNKYFAWWVSRDSLNMTYWGGAAPDSGKCACGMDGTCAHKNHRCNCDANDAVWREDSGLLTDKTHLPVKQLRFGDTDEKRENGLHTLGKFKCYGTA